MSDNFRNFKNGVNLEPLSADPSNPKEGDLFNSDGTSRAKGLWEYKDAAWQQGKPGDSSLLEYISGDNTPIADWDVTNLTNATLTLDSATELNGISSYLLTNHASAAAEYIESENIAIPRRSRSNEVGIKFKYKYTGATDDIDVYIYDVTNAVELQAGNISASTESSTYFLPALMASTTAEIRIGVRVLVGNGSALLTFDDIEVSDNPFQYKNLLSENAVYLTNQNGHGSINTKIRRFLTTQTNTGNAITYADSATLGGSFTINKTGIYNISYSDSFNTTSTLSGISLNSSELTTNIDGITEADCLAIEWDADANSPRCCSWSGKLNSGDVIRAHTRGGTDHSLGQNSTIFSISSNSETENIIAHSSQVAEDSMVRLHTGNAFGSSSTSIRRFSTTVTNIGNAITYADSATLGASFTINESGIYYFTYIDNFSAASSAMGLSLNTSQPTTSISSITAADRLVRITSVSTGNANEVSWAGYLAAGDVVRPHCGGGLTGNDSAANQQFIVSKLGTKSLIGSPIPRTAYIKHVETTVTTGGGTSSTQSWDTRTLNVINEDGSETSSGSSFCSLTANQFTLGAGQYRVVAHAPVYNCASTITKVYNITDSADQVELISQNGRTNGANVEIDDVISGILTLTSSKTFELRSFAQIGVASNGYGFPHNGVGVDAYSNIYTEIKIEKIL